MTSLDDQLPGAIGHLRTLLPDMRALYLFGSGASGELCRESDIDLAILPDAAIPPGRLAELREGLELLLDRDVDLIDLRTASTVLRKIIVTEGRRVYSARGPEADFFETTAVAMWMRLNEDRAEIIEAIRLRGSVYGGRAGNG